MRRGCVDVCFFFQAEDGIRDYKVTGVQTCALPIYPLLNTFIGWGEGEFAGLLFHELAHQVVYVAGDTAFNESFATTDRKSTRLNSSHLVISYAVFCLKKKKNKIKSHTSQDTTKTP